MTAPEAREAADFFRREVAVGEQTLAAPRHPLIDASEHGQGVADIAKVTAFKRAAAVALEAYADRQEMTAEDMVQLVEMGKRAEREACALLTDRTEARWREQERTSDDDFARSRCFARADVAATLARAIRARGAK